MIRSYLWITGLFWLAASIIWGVNTLFLLDAGLSLFETFVANAAWTAGMVIFEIPTGLVADTRGRRVSFLLSAGVLAVGTVIYVVISWAGGGLLPFVLVSLLLGLAYTFYSGAVEAWLVDALRATGYTGELDPVFARGGVVSGGAMLVGTVGGGLLGTVDLAWPYLARSALLVAAFAVALRGMRDLGFTPRAVRVGDVAREMRGVARASVRYGLRHRSVRLLMVASFAQFGVMAWAFYAWQPYFLDLLGRDDVVWVAGLVAAMIALARIAGNALVGRVARAGRRRSTILVWGAVALAASLAGVGLVSSFLAAVVILLVGIAIAGLAGPVRQAYLHEVIPSEQRATVVSFDSLFGSLGSVGGQTGLGYLAQVQSISVGFVASGLIAALAVPVLGLLRRTGERADRITAPIQEVPVGEPPEVAGVEAAQQPVEP